MRRGGRCTRGERCEREVWAGGWFSLSSPGGEGWGEEAAFPANYLLKNPNHTSAQRSSRVLREGGFAAWNLIGQPWLEPVW
jgi:hypothetical protein